MYSLQWKAGDEFREKGIPQCLCDGDKHIRAIATSDDCEDFHDLVGIQFFNKAGEKCDYHNSIPVALIHLSQLEKVA